MSAASAAAAAVSTWRMSAWRAAVVHGGYRSQRSASAASAFARCVPRWKLSSTATSAGVCAAASGAARACCGRERRGAPGSPRKRGRRSHCRDQSVDGVPALTSTVGGAAAERHEPHSARSTRAQPRADHNSCCCRLMAAWHGDQAQEVSGGRGAPEPNERLSQSTTVKRMRPCKRHGVEGGEARRALCNSGSNACECAPRR